jgi:hypothetical protein
MKSNNSDLSVARAVIRAYRAGDDTVSPDEARFAARVMGTTLRKAEAAKRLRASAGKRRPR